MSQRPPDRKTILIYLAIGLLLVAIVAIAFGGAGGFRLVRLLAIYGGAFLLLLWVLQRKRR